MRLPAREEGKDREDKAGQKEQCSGAERADAGRCKLTEFLLPEPAVNVREAEGRPREVKRTGECGRIETAAIVSRPFLSGVDSELSSTGPVLSAEEVEARLIGSRSG